MCMPAMQKNVPGKAAVPRHVFCYYTAGICMYFLFFVFLNNKRILMPHID